MGNTIEENGQDPNVPAGNGWGISVDGYLPASVLDYCNIVVNNVRGNVRGEVSSFPPFPP
jgi:hypothetical protein